MRKVSLVLAAFGLLVSGSAMARVSLKTVEKAGYWTATLPGMPVQIRAPLGTRLAGAAIEGGFVPVRGKMNRTRTAMLYTLEAGHYKDARTKKTFEVRPRFAIEPRPAPPHIAIEPRPAPPHIAIEPRPAPPHIAIEPRPAPPHIAIEPRPAPPHIAVDPRPTAK
jgi:hypothetical protein